MLKCPDRCKNGAQCGCVQSPMTTPRGSGFQRETMAEEVAAMEELCKLDKRVERFYGEQIRARTMAAAGIIAGEQIEERIVNIARQGANISAQLRAFADRVDRSVETTKDHLIGHLSEKEAG